MDMEAGKTLTNEEVIRELLELLKKNAMKEQANDVFEICSYVDGLEKKIDSMTEELTNMQNQIKEMQEDTLVNNAKKALSEAQERLNTRCEQIKSQVLEVKEQVKSTAKGIVEEAKEKGRAALYRGADGSSFICGNGDLGMEGRSRGVYSAGHIRRIIHAALFSALICFPVTDEREEPDAAGYHGDGDTFQRNQCDIAGCQLFQLCIAGKVRTGHFLDKSFTLDRTHDFFHRNGH